MKKKKFKLRIKNRIKEWKSEIAESVDDVNVQSKQKPLSAEQIVKIGEAIKWYQRNIAINEEILRSL